MPCCCLGVYDSREEEDGQGDQDWKRGDNCPTQDAVESILWVRPARGPSIVLRQTGLLIILNRLQAFRYTLRERAETERQE